MDGSYKTAVATTPDVVFGTIPGTANVAPARMAKLQGNAFDTSGDARTNSLFPTFTQPGDQRFFEMRSATANDAQKYVRVVGTVR